VANKNNNKTYFVVYNKHGISNVLLNDGQFKEALIKSNEPVILNSDLFNEGYFSK